MYKSRTSLVYTFRGEEIFEFLSKSVHPRNVHGSKRLYEDKYNPRYVHGTSLECRGPVGLYEHWLTQWITCHFFYYFFCKITFVYFWVGVRLLNHSHLFRSQSWPLNWQGLHVRSNLHITATSSHSHNQIRRVPWKWSSLPCTHQPTRRTAAYPHGSEWKRDGRLGIKRLKPTWS